MPGTGMSTKLIPLLATLGLVAVLAASCSSEATTTNAVDAAADEQSSVTTTVPAPDADVAAFTAAFGRGDADEAWSYHSARCLSVLPQDHHAVVTGYAAEVPGATATNFSTEISGDKAAVSYDVYNGSGEYVDSYFSQPWIFSDGKWYRDAC